MKAAFADSLAGAQPVNIWRAPDLEILTGGRTVPPTMPSDMFGGVWPLIGDIARGAGAPVDYTAIGLIAAVASLVGGKRRVRPFSSGDWSEPCILWAAIVGDPSHNKSPALDPISNALNTLELDHASDHRHAMMAFETRLQRAKAERKLWEKDVEGATKDGQATPDLPDAAVLPDEPQRRRLMLQDGTPEAVAAILVGNPTGTLLLRDELAGWLLSFDRYSPGGRAFWLEAYGGRPFIVDRRSAAGSLRVPFNGVSVLGGIQPEKLVELLLSGSDDGMVARFLWTWPDAIPYTRPTKLADLQRLERLLRRLDGLQPGRDANGERVLITLTLDDRAGDIFEAWIGEHQSGLADTASLYKGFCGKLKGMVLRLALVSELLCWADGDARDEPQAVTASTIVSVIEFVEDYAKPTARRVFGDAALPPVERNAAALARYIQKTKPAKLNARDVRRTCGIPALKSAETLADAIGYLVDADWLRPAPDRDGDTAGRRRSDYIVNPGVIGTPL